MRGYDRSALSSDLLAALILTAMLVPQGMAYALLAGLPAEYGLYASTIPAIVYGLFGTSRHMPVGPPALMALLTFASVSAIAEPGSAEYISLALLLAVMIGVLQLAVGLLKMGFITNFISSPVLHGFIYASAVLIMLTQVKHLLGIPISTHGSVVSTVLEIGRNIAETNPVTLAVSAASFAALVFFAKVLPRLPGMLVVVVVSTLAVYLLGLDQKGVSIVGDVPEGLPGFSLPDLDLESIRAQLTAALVVAFVGFVESISVAKAIAARANYEIDSNQELRALGLANMSAGLFSGFPVAGSFSRAAVQYKSGGRTQAASIMTALLILVTLLFLTPLFYYLPNAALAAVVVTAVYGLIDFKEVRHVFQIRAVDGLALVITFAVTLFVGVEQGVIFGAVFGLIMFIRRTAYPKISELGYVEEEDAFLDTERFPEAKTYPEALIIRFEASLYFANISFLEDWLIDKAAERPELKWIVINCRGVNSIDVTAIEGLERLISEFRSRGVEVLFTGMKLPVSNRVLRAGWDKKLEENMNYRTTREALQTIGLLEDQ